MTETVMFCDMEGFTQLSVGVPWKLPLLGGNTGRTSPYGFHDWEFILQESGLLKYDHVLANFSYKIGTVLMICAFLWGGIMLFKQYKNLN